HRRAGARAGNGALCTLRLTRRRGVRQPHALRAAPRVRRPRGARGPRTMSVARSDALVLFGATGDLARRKLFPALHALVRSGTLRVPVIGVARSGWTVDEFRRHVSGSL